MDNKKNRKHGAYIAGIVFILLIFLCPVLLFLGDKKTFSEEENRSLALMPDFNLANVVDGDFQDGFEAFITDQFPKRNQLNLINTRLRLAIGQSVINNVRYHDDYLIETLDINSLDTERVFKSREYLSKAASYFESQSLSTSVIWLPDKEEAFGISHPSWELNNVCNNTLTLDLELNDFYKTDHHWTSDGAYKAYEEIAKWAGFTDITELNTKETVCDDFLGSTHSKTLFSKSKDIITKYNLPYEIDLSVEYPNDYAKDLSNPTGLYQYDKLDGKNKYEFFLGGNTSYIHIRNSFSADNRGKLLLFKDSFTNSLIPFLAANFDEILLVDLRYTGSDLSSQIDEYDADEVMFIFNRTSFVNETNLYKLADIYEENNAIEDTTEDDILIDDDDNILIDDDDILIDDEGDILLDGDDDILIDNEDDILVEDEDDILIDE